MTAGWLEAVLLAGVRVTAFLVVAPPFSASGIPASVKALLGMAIAFAIVPSVAAGYQPTDLVPFLTALVSQLFIGLLLGFLVMLTFSAAQSAGTFVDLFGGYQLAMAFDPSSSVNGAQFARLFHMLALALLFVSDGYQLILAGLLRTFDVVGIAGALPSVPDGQVLIAGLSQLFLAALQIAGPLLVVLFLADVGLGLLTRVAPQLNALALGFPLKMLIAVMFGGLVIVAMPRLVESMTGGAVDGMLGVLP